MGDDDKKGLGHGIARTAEVVGDLVREAFLDPNAKLRREVGKQVLAKMASGEVEPDTLEAALVARAYDDLYRRSQNQEAVQQKAIEAFSSGAVPLPDGGETKIDPDFRERLLEDSGVASSEDLRMLYGRILAHKLADPDAVSKKTLGVLRDLDTDVAHAFDDALPWVVQAGTRCFVPFFDAGADEVERGYPVESVIHDLADTGLISSSDASWWIDGEENSKAVFSYAKFRIQIVAGLDTWGYREFEALTLFELTRPGRELMGVSAKQPSRAYFDAILGALRRQWTRCEVTWAHGDDVEFQDSDPPPDLW